MKNLPDLVRNLSSTDSIVLYLSPFFLVLEDHDQRMHLQDPKDGDRFTFNIVGGFAYTGWGGEFAVHHSGQSVAHVLSSYYQKLRRRTIFGPVKKREAL